MRWTLVFVFFTSSAQAEYRAFLLRIEKINNPSDSRQFVSTLDPLQYPTYYPLQLDEKISYLSTWMCSGRTNERPICPDPKAPKVAEESQP